MNENQKHYLKPSEIPGASNFAEKDDILLLIVDVMNSDLDQLNVLYQMMLSKKLSDFLRQLDKASGSIDAIPHQLPVRLLGYALAKHALSY